MTVCLEGRCSIQLSYATRLSEKGLKDIFIEKAICCVGRSLLFAYFKDYVALLRNPELAVPIKIKNHFF